MPANAGLISQIDLQQLCCKLCRKLYIRPVPQLFGHFGALTTFSTHFLDERLRRLQGTVAGHGPQDACLSGAAGLYRRVRGWRGRAPRQPGQVRKEAAVTSPAWVVVQPLTFLHQRDTDCCRGAHSRRVGRLCACSLSVDASKDAGRLHVGICRAFLVHFLPGTGNKPIGFRQEGGEGARIAEITPASSASSTTVTGTVSSSVRVQWPGSRTTCPRCSDRGGPDRVTKPPSSTRAGPEPGPGSRAMGAGLPSETASASDRCSEFRSAHAPGGA